MKRAIDAEVIKSMKSMYRAGAKANYIANAFGVSSATYQNVKKTGWNYNAYRTLVTNQIEYWMDKLEKKNKKENVKTSKIPVPFNKPTTSNNGAVYEMMDVMNKRIMEVQYNITSLTNRINEIFPKRNK